MILLKFHAGLLVWATLAVVDAVTFTTLFKPGWTPVFRYTAELAAILSLRETPMEFRKLLSDSLSSFGAPYWAVA